MQDPNPENIMGEKRVAHSVTWEINVGYVVVGAAVLFVAWKLLGGLSVSSSSEEDDDLPAVEVESVGETPFIGGAARGGD